MEMASMAVLDLIDLKQDMQFILDSVTNMESTSNSGDLLLTEVYQRVEAINDKLNEMGIGDE